MPFNMAVAGIGGRTFILAEITADDTEFAYDVEAQVLSQFGVGTSPLDQIHIIFRKSGIMRLTAKFTNWFCIDANSVDPDAFLSIEVAVGTVRLMGKGGKGGDGGDGVVGEAGAPGAIGGTAIRLGCSTAFVDKGPGSIEVRKGFGGGGGGGGATGFNGGGGGGGGGSQFGLGGSPGQIGASAGSPSLGDGETGGAGGAGGFNGGAGGEGGDKAGPAAQAGTAGNGGGNGGAAGVDGDAMDTQGFDYSTVGSITFTGDII